MDTVTPRKCEVCSAVFHLTITSFALLMDGLSLTEPTEIISDCHLLYFDLSDQENLRLVFTTDTLRLSLTRASILALAHFITEHSNALTQIQQLRPQSSTESLKFVVSASIGAIFLSLSDGSLATVVSCGSVSLLSSIFQDVTSFHFESDSFNCLLKPNMPIIHSDDWICVEIRDLGDSRSATARARLGSLSASLNNTWVKLLNFVSLISTQIPTIPSKPFVALDIDAELTSFSGRLATDDHTLVLQTGEIVFQPTSESVLLLRINALAIFLDGDPLIQPVALSTLLAYRLSDN
jgi:hypothetical protein